MKNKLLDTIKDAIVSSGLKDGDIISFHHQLRDGDYVLMNVVEEIAKLGIKDITIAATSLGSAHDGLINYIQGGVITGLQTSGIRGKLGAAVSHGILDKEVILRSHGGRVRAIENGELKIDVAFLAASSSDEYGNASGKNGIHNCGVLSYGMVDAKYAKKVVIITDTLVDFPNYPASIKSTDVDYVVKIDAIGDPDKIASSVMQITQNPKELMIAEKTVEVMQATPYFKDEFSYQTGAGKSSLAVNRFLEEAVNKYNYKIGWAIGGITAPMVDLLNKGLIKVLVDAQDFDTKAVESVNMNKNHYEISTSEYASPNNKGAFVDRLDFTILSALEIDLDFNVNVVLGSDGILRGAPGGHPDSAQGAKCTIIVAPLIRGRLATVTDKVLSITTPGKFVDVFVCEYGIAVNPDRKDIITALEKNNVATVSINKLRDKALSIVGKPDPISFLDKTVAIMEDRQGGILDVIKMIKTT